MLTWACLATIAVAGLHTIGNTLPSEPPDAAYHSVTGAMRGYTIPLGMGMAPSLWDVYRALVFTMSICFVAMGALGLVVAGSPDATPRILTRTAWTLTLSSIALLILYWYYRIPPPLISMIVVTALFAVAIRTTAHGGRAGAR
jgi:ribose/xylose/arabinose/galactoside ABC-type transport system permease subunit